MQHLMLISFIYISILLPNPNLQASAFKIEKIADLDNIVWGFDFLPNGEQLLVTKKNGTMSIIDLKTKNITEITGVPEVAQVGQGGLLDIKLHPKFNENRTIFFTFAKNYNGGTGTVLARAQIQGSALQNIKLIFQSDPPGDGGRHFGSRIVFKDEHIFFGVGDRGDRHKAQSLKFPNGKVFRIKMDGSIPKDNPFVGKKDAIAAIWSYGHRNPQGIDIHPESNEIYEQEHGPRGGDEINHIKKGLNYGWPKATYGREYWGLGIGSEKVPGTEQPVKYYVPSIAPSSLMIYSGKMFPQWKNHFFNAALKSQHINIVAINDKKAGPELKIAEDLGERIRHIDEAPNGAIYFSTDSGKIFKIVK